MEEDISTLPMETYVMLISTSYISVTIVSKYTEAAYDKPYNITVMPTAAFKNFCHIMTV
jgi:hypothetical protein